jgi:plasmid maintenance system antidote protein VapI
VEALEDDRDYFGVSSELWLSRQADFDLQNAQRTIGGGNRETGPRPCRVTSGAYTAPV